MKKIYLHACVFALAGCFSIKANAQNTAPFWSLAGNSGTNPNTQFLGTTDNKALVFRTQNKIRMRIGQGGFVGIGTGTTPPVALLHVKATDTRVATFDGPNGMYIEVNENAAPRGYFGSTAGNNEDFDLGTNSLNATGKLHFTIKAIPKMTIDASGNVGIGQTAPAVKLHVTGGSDATLTSGGYIVAGNLSSDNIVIDDNEIMARNGTNADGSSTLYLNNGGGDINFRQGAMKISNDKLVGIGTTSPTNKLHVVGTTLLNGHVSIGSEQPDANWDLKIGTTTNDGFLMGTVETLEDFGGSTFGSNSNIIPTADDSRSLGNSTNRWHDVWAADGTINTSDARDKKNIRDMDYGLKQIMQLHAVKFNWKNEVNSKDKLGVIAQEIQKVLPEVVRDYDIKTDEATGKQQKVPSARLGVMYADIIPVLIKSIQELETQVTDLQKQLSGKTQNASNASAASKVAPKSAINAVLEQNSPNPFSSNTLIRYIMPSAVSNAQIILTNNSGNTVKTFTLNSKGSGSVTINANELIAGNYFYTLLVDGKKVDTKQMVLVK